MKAKITIELEDGDKVDADTPETKAVQIMQDGLAAAARTPPEELALIWRAAVAAEHRRNARPKRPRHEHRGKGAAA